jgi:tryptophanyl-tRNA synthetase
MIKHNPKWIYLMRCVETDGTVSYKIGYTKNDPKKRVKQLQTGNKNEITLVEKFWSEYSTRLEATLHHTYKHYRDDRGEWFDLPKDVVKNFVSICEKHEKNFKLLVSSNTYLEDLNNRR